MEKQQVGEVPVLQLRGSHCEIVGKNRVRQPWRLESRARAALVALPHAFPHCSGNPLTRPETKS